MGRLANRAPAPCTEGARELNLHQKASGPRSRLRKAVGGDIPLPLWGLGSSRPLATSSRFLPAVGWGWPGGPPLGLPSAPQGWDDGDGGHPRDVQGLAEGSPHGSPVWPRFPTPQRGGPRPGGGTPGAGSDPLAGMFVIWASVSLPVSWSDEPAGSLLEGMSGSARERVSHISEVVWDGAAQ